MLRHDLAHLLRGAGAGVHSGLDSAHVAADHHGHQAGADLLIADQSNIGGLGHSIGSLNRANQTFGLDHTERFTHSDNLLLIT